MENLRGRLKTYLQEYYEGDGTIHTMILPARGKRDVNEKIRKGVMVFSTTKISKRTLPKEIKVFF